MGCKHALVILMRRILSHPVDEYIHRRPAMSNNQRMAC